MDDNYSRTSVVKKRLVLKKCIRSFISRFFITGIIFLTGLILVKGNSSFKKVIVDNLYNKSYDFMEVKNIYDKYVKNLIGMKTDTSEVFSEKLSYKKQSKYKDGVLLSVSDNYMVPILESGIVIFIGEKEGYGNTIIIEQINGIDVWYGNVKSNNIKMYDYVEKSKLLGEVNSNKLYLVFQKDEKVLDYKKYI